jgi:hypothetical protein
MISLIFLIDVKIIIEMPDFTGYTLPGQLLRDDRLVPVAGRCREEAEKTLSLNFT